MNAAADRSAADGVQSRRADTHGASVTGKKLFESVMRFTLRSFSDEFNARCSRDGYRKGREWTQRIAFGAAGCSGRRFKAGRGHGAVADEE